MLFLLYKALSEQSLKKHVPLVTTWEFGDFDKTLHKVTGQAPVGLTRGWTEQSETESKQSLLLLFSVLLGSLLVHPIYSVFGNIYNVGHFDILMTTLTST